MHSPLPMDDREAVRCPGGLYVVATPIGNLEDITLRAIKTLAGVDLIAAEDTRHTARLLSHYRIATPLISCHAHNERQRTGDLIEKIRSGAAVALVSDAGTPSVSDPGFRLVRAAVEQGLPVIPIPGVSAVVTALCASGLPTDAFLFLGFAPKKKGQRMQLLKSLAAETRTLIFYESPRRVVAFLDEIRSAMGDRPAVLAREMTKLHEEFIRSSLSEIKTLLTGRPHVKGECTLLVQWPGETDAKPETELIAALRHALAQPGTHLSDLAKTYARQYKLPKKTIYEIALNVQKEAQKSS